VISVVARLLSDFRCRLLLLGVVVVVCCY
jgi:hypothetical protein